MKSELFHEVDERLLAERDAASHRLRDLIEDRAGTREFTPGAERQVSA